MPKAISPFLGKHRAKTHAECRAALCAVCFSGGPFIQAVTTTIESQIQEFLHKDFSLAKYHLPSSICSSCRLKLSKYTKVFYKLKIFQDI